MTNGKSLARWCKAQIGTSYKIMDCIKLIVNGIRKADGADGESLSYTCGGTNELWRSINKSGKYRYVTEIVTIDEAKNRGMLVPGRLMVIWEPGHNAKYNDELGDCSHIGVYVGDADCEAVHSSATRGQVATTTVKNGYTHVLSHRLVDLRENTTGSAAPTTASTQPAQTGGASGNGRVLQASMVVTTEKDPLNVRDRPSVKGTVVGKAARGSTVTTVGAVQTVVEDGVSRQWVEIAFKPANRRNEQTGYACTDYLVPISMSVNAAPSDSCELDDVIVPRSAVLALADATDAFENMLYLKKWTMSMEDRDTIDELRDAARNITAYLEGDD